MKIIRIFYLQIFIYVVRFSVYLNRHVFVIYSCLFCLLVSCCDASIVAVCFNGCPLYPACIVVPSGAVPVDTGEISNE